MKILVTGGAGYLGSTLLPKLLVRGHQVRVLDYGYFGLGHIRNLSPQPELIRDDVVRLNQNDEFAEQILEGCRCVVHLAAMSNDPAADLDPHYTDAINTQATIALAKAAKKKGVKFIFASSCSVYGGSGKLIDESGALNPLTAYAVSKVRAEEALLAMAEDSWRPIILRFGTLFGYSPRMRFDLVVNIFSLFSTLKGEIKIFGTGTHWRPFLHVKDAARAIAFFADKKEWRHPIYNIAHQNLRVRDVAEVFSRLIPSLKVTEMPLISDDPRDYRVTTERMSTEGFQTRLSVDTGAEEIQEAIVSGLIPDPQSILYQNVKWLKELGLTPRPQNWVMAAAA